MTFLQSLLQRMKLIPAEEERERNASVWTADGQSARAALEDERLEEFRLLVGISSSSSFKGPKGYDPKRPPVFRAGRRLAPNIGVYPTVVKNEYKCKQNYKKFSRLTSFCLFFQIVIAAALTALGASNGSHNAVTVFGGLNTVIAGFLTFLRGSGFPNRLKYYAHQWSQLREYIEQKERDLLSSHHRHKMDIHAEVDTIRAMFNDVKADVEANTPDRFVGSGGLSARLASITKPQTVSVMSDVPHVNMNGLMGGMHDARSKMERISKEIDVSSTHEEMERARRRLYEDVSVVKSKLRQRLEELDAIEAEAEVQAKNAFVAGEKEAEQLAADRVKEVGELENDIENARVNVHDHMHEAFQEPKR